MKKKGFTLVELIAVLVIMAIIALISVPIVFNQIESTRLESYKASVRNVLGAVSSYMAKSEGVDNFPNEGLIIPTSEYYKNLSLKNANFISGRIFLNEEGVLVAKEISDGTFCASGTKNDLDVIKGACEFIDDTKPEINVMVNRITTTSITVSVNSSDNESGITDYKYYLNGKLIAETKNNIYTFKDLKPNTEYEIKVVTVNGNNLEAEQTLNVTTVIREILIESKPEGWSHSKTVTITFSKETGNEIYRYKKVGDINWINVAGNKVDFLIEQNRTIIAQILAPNGEVVIEVTKAIGSIDNDKPEILGINGNDEVWKLSKQITINATDGVGSGVDSYSFDGGTTWQAENKKVVTERQTLNVAVKDKLGNISDVKTYEILYIDNTIPKAHSITASTSAGVYENDTWTNKTVTLTANPNPVETPSGYAYQWYEKSGENFIAIEGATNKTLVLENDITKSYRVDIRTNAGSEATTSSNDYIVKIDKIPPSCNMQAQYTTWTKNNRTLKLTCSDSASDCSPNTLEKIWTFNTTKKTETLSYLVKDNAGNSKTCTYNNYGVYVDKDQPELTIGQAVTTTNSSTIPYYADDISGIGSYTCKYVAAYGEPYISAGNANYSANASNVTSTSCILNNLKENTNYYYQICVTDNVGNISTCKNGSVVSKIIEKPSITFTNTPTTPINGYLKKQIAHVSYISTGITNPRYFVKTTREGTSSLTVTKSCGTGNTPTTSCSTITGTTTLTANTWYEVSGNVDVTYDKVSNTMGTIYAATYDGTSFVNPIPSGTINKLAQNVNYTVRHYQMNTDMKNYTLVATENLTGAFASSVTPSVKTYTGFNSPSKQTVTLAGDGSTVINYYYTRKQVTATFYKNTSTSDTTTATQTFTYGVSGQSFSAKGWSRTGYTLVGWAETSTGTGPYSTLNGVADGWINSKSPRIKLYAVWVKNPTVTFAHTPSTLQNGYAKSSVATVTYSSTNVTSPVYYIRTTRAGTSSVAATQSCGTGSSPGTCTTITSTTSLAANTWYKISGNTKVTYNTAASSAGTLYAYIYDGTTAKAQGSGTIPKTDADSPTISIGTLSVDDTSIKIPYTLSDQSGIGSYTCNYEVLNPAISAENATYGSNATNVSTTSCTLNNLNSFYNYYYRICATDKVGNASKCVYGQTKTTDSTNPSLSLNGSSSTTSSATVSFSASDAHSGISKTICEYGTSTSYGKTGSISNGICTMSGLATNTKYYYKITTTNGAGLSTEKTSSVTTKAATSCGWSLNPTKEGTTITFTFTPSSGCSFKNIEYMQHDDTYSNDSSKHYPYFVCSYNMGQPVACNKTPAPTLSLNTNSSSKYVYKFTNIESDTRIFVKFRATFTNGTTSGDNYRIDGCYIYQGLYENASEPWQKMC